QGQSQRQGEVCDGGKRDPRKRLADIGDRSGTKKTESGQHPMVWAVGTADSKCCPVVMLQLEPLQDAAQEEGRAGNVERTCGGKLDSLPSKPPLPRKKFLHIFDIDGDWTTGTGTQVITHESTPNDHLREAHACEADGWSDTG
ncbi:unnamed protein product, partial [Discosporangium mesarthrocarpum]